MDLSDTRGEAEFRTKARKWLEENKPKGIADRGFALAIDEETIKLLTAWQRRLYEAGYLGLSWPVEYGGQGKTIIESAIFNEEMARVQAPAPLNELGLSMGAPTILEHGTEEQKKRFIRKILSCEEIWCQGFSEPASGSDLAALQTRAIAQGDEFIVNGQKVWTSNAQFAEWMFCLVRTDAAAPKHRGISYLLIDMHTPGITVRPLIQMTGDPGFNEVFFENVRVPRHNLVGELNQGWLVANATLAHERNMLGSTTRTQEMFNGLLRLAQTHQRHGRPAAADPVIRQRLADLLIRVEAMKYHAYRQLTDLIKHKPPGIGASVNKLVSTELNHDITALALEVMGSYGPLARASRRVINRGGWPVEFMFTLGLIIGGGTSQIQKNIISERGLGMPR